MPIPTTPGLEGFIKSRPRMTMTVNGDPRMSCWVGIPQSQQDANGAWHEAEPLEAEMVMFGPSAQKAFAKIRPGDHIVATGKEASYPIEQDGQIVEREYFHASHIGPDNNVTAFTVHRGPERYNAEREATQREAARQASFEQAEQAPQEAAQQAPAQQTVTGQGAAAQAAPEQGAPQQAATQGPPTQAMPAQQAGPAADDPVAEVLSQRQQQVAAEPHTPTSSPPGPDGIAR